MPFITVSSMVYAFQSLAKALPMSPGSTVIVSLRDHILHSVHKIQGSPKLEFPSVVELFVVGLIENHAELQLTEF